MTDFYLLMHIYCRRHVRMHVSRPTFPCSICKKNFSRADNLRRHKKEAHLQGGEVDDELASIGQRILQQRAESINEITTGLIDYLRASGETEAKISEVKQIMESRMYNAPTSSRSSFAATPSTPQGASPAAILGPSSTPATSSSSTLDSLPGSSSSTQPGSMSGSPLNFTDTPAGVSSSLAQVFSKESDTLQIVNLGKGDHAIKLPADKSYLLVPVQAKVNDEPRRSRRRPAPPPTPAPQGKFRCDPCDKEFRDSCNLKDHCKRVHGERSKPMECERFFCHASFNCLREKKAHMAACFWVCPEPGCTRTGLKWRQEVRLHKQSHLQRYEKLARIEGYLTQ